LLLANVLLVVQHAFSQTLYNSTWASLDARPTPQWYLDAKFGIFIHWGVYSVPAWAPVGVYAEWYWDALETVGSETQVFHNETYGEKFKYQDFVSMFHAELYNPQEWVDLFIQAGAKYIVPTSKHHEGFTLWPSAQSWNWNSVDIGPHRDLLGDLLTTAKNSGLRAGAYYSLYEWFHPLYTSPNPQIYVEQIMLPQLYDLVENYQPDILWADGEWEHTSDFWQTPTFLAYLFNQSPVKDVVAINDRWGSDTRNIHGGFYTPEYSNEVFLTHKWEENSGVDLFSYGYNRNTPANKYYSAQFLINLLIRTVAYGGNLLLDVGPESSGKIPNIMQERLLQIGSFLNVSGQAIYSTRQWRVQQENSTTIKNLQIYYTQAPPLVFAIINNLPGSQLSLNTPIFSSNTQVYLLGSSLDVPLKVSGTIGKPGLVIQIPADIDVTQYAWAFKLVNVS